jgi:flagellar motor switch protein FliM
MSLSQVLDQAEIDALLGSGDDEPEEQEHDKTKPRTFDFSHDRIVRGRMPTLEMINERYARNIRISLFNFLRRSPEISSQGVSVVKYGEYVNSLFLPTSLNIIKMHPLKGQMLFILDAKLVYILVDNFFGGEGKFHNKIEGRDFTMTETRLIMRFLEIAFKDMVEAWRAVMDVNFEYVNSEVNPAMANIISPSEMVVISKFRIELEGGAGEMHITIPYGVLEPIRDLLDSGVQSDKDHTDERWINLIHNEIYGCKIAVKAILAKKEVKLKDIMEMNIGDILPVEMPEYATMYTEHVPSFLVKLGRSSDKYALKIMELIVTDKPTERKIL